MTLLSRARSFVEQKKSRLAAAALPLAALAASAIPASATAITAGFDKGTCAVTLAVSGGGACTSTSSTPGGNPNFNAVSISGTIGGFGNLSLTASGSASGTLNGGIKFSYVFTSNHAWDLFFELNNDPAYKFDVTGSGDGNGSGTISATGLQLTSWTVSLTLVNCDPCDVNIPAGSTLDINPAAPAATAPEAAPFVLAGSGALLLFAFFRRQA